MPPGSAAIEDLYESYYTLIGEPRDHHSRASDYQAFIGGIPSGGLFTGAEVVKTEQQAMAPPAQFDPATTRRATPSTMWTCTPLRSTAT